MLCVSHARLCRALVLPARTTLPAAAARARARAAGLHVGRAFSSAATAGGAPAAAPAAPPLAGPALADAGTLNLGDLIVTASCARRIAAIRARRVAQGDAAAEGLYLRVRVDGGGCSGFKYTFEYDASPIDAEEDVVFELNGSRVVVDTVSLDQVRGSTVDWIEDMSRAAFAITNNPRAGSTCGCGSSFAVKE